jgi:hypothetical protein
MWAWGVVRRFAAKVRDIQDVKTMHGSTLATFALHALPSPLCKELLQTVEPLILHHLGAMTRVDLSYILSAYSKSKVGSTYFYTAIIHRLVDIKSSLNAIDIASITQALAKIGRGGEQYLLQLEDCVINVQNIRTKDLCLILNAYSKTSATKIFVHYEAEILRRKQELDARQLATVLNAYCRRKPESRLFSVLLARVVEVEMDAWAVANVIHAYATAMEQPKSVLTALRPKLRFEDMKPRELVQVYWGYSRVMGFEEVLVRAKSHIISKAEDLDADAVSLVITCQVTAKHEDLIDLMMQLIRRKKDLREALLANTHLLIRTVHALAKGNWDAFALELYTFAPKTMCETLFLDDFAVLLISLCKINAPVELIRPFIDLLPKHFPLFPPKHTINLFFQLSRMHYSSLFDLKSHRSLFDLAVSRSKSPDQSTSTQIQLVTKHLEVS